MIEFELFTSPGRLFHKLVLQPKNFCHPIDFFEFLSCKSSCAEERSPLYPGTYDSIRSVRYFGRLIMHYFINNKAQLEYESLFNW